MNVLHTSDWHLGKRLMDRERLPEQIAALDEIAAICEREQVEVVLVAGDVFDTYLPSAEAEEAFFRGVKKLAGRTRAVVIISGNHDDGVRLSAGAPFAGEQGVFLFGNKPSSPALGGERPVRAVSAGEYFVLLENERGERLYVNALPYPNEARFREDKTEEAFSAKVKRWIARGDEGYDRAAAHVLLTHLFVAGGRTSESERDIDLGGARAVPLSALPAEGYVALGHLHRAQDVGANARYSGSLLQYSFDEANTQKSVTLFTVRGKSISNVREIALTAGRRLVRLECNGAEEALALLPRYGDAYIELTLHLRAPLTTQETQSLRAAAEGLVSLAARVETGESVAPVMRSQLTHEQLFTEYYRSRFGEAPERELTAAFLELLGEEV